MGRAPFTLAGHEVLPGQRLQIDVPVARLYTHTPLHIPVEVVHGRKEGPVMLVCGGIHGDEINGVEIVRRVLRSKSINSLRGTLIAVPVVNVFGFLQQTRYLPDRRDLNRCFPGSEKGSLGGVLPRCSEMRSSIMRRISSTCTRGRFIAPTCRKFVRS